MKGRERATVVYFCQAGGFLVLPLAKNAEGARVGVNQPELLQWGDSCEVALGEKVLHCMGVSAVTIGPPRSDPAAFLLASGAKSYLAFARVHHQVYVMIPDGGGCLSVQYWPRNANFMFVGPPDDRPDFTVTLPEDATPEQVGSAVVRVLRAGGVGIEGQPDFHGTAASGGDDRVGYAEFKSALAHDYELMVAGNDSPVEAVTGLLDRVGRTISEDPCLFHCAIITCALICLGQGFLPDYLDEPVRGLGDVSGLLSGDDVVVYRQDVAALQHQLAAGVRVVEAPCPPDYFPGTWGMGQAAAEAWWNGLLGGMSQPGQ